jgi:SPP1 family predicted phage head-tail adaptor
VIGAGQLASRLTLQAPIETDDGQGGAQRAYVTVVKVWAQVTLSASRATIAADALGATTRVHIVVRAPLELTLQHRFIDDGDVYAITGYRDDGQTIEIDAELRVV